MLSSQIILINRLTWSIYKLDNNIPVNNGLVDVQKEFLCYCIWWELSAGVIINEIFPRIFIINRFIPEVVSLYTNGRIYDKVCRANAAIFTIDTEFVLNSFVDKTY